MAVMPSEKARPSIYDLDYSQLEHEMISLGEPKYRAQQIWHGLYRDPRYSIEAVSTLPVKLHETLRERFVFSSLVPSKSLQSRNGDTIKTLFTLPDGHAVEAVLMRYRDRRTLCISSQSGCAMGCVFCATGQMGFKRNLTSGEIIEQVIYYARLLAAENQRVTNIVVMGMGEPMHNYDSTMSAIDRMNHPEGLALGARRFTVSTVGLIPGIRRFTREKKQINLAVSLHAADNALRSTLLPINQKYPLEHLMEACLDYVTDTKRRISFEWALIRDMNDTDEQAYKLSRLLKPFLANNIAMCHVNIIQLNPTRRYEGKAGNHSQALNFQSILTRNGIPCTIRVRRGIEIQAGCGQLASE